MYTHTLHYTILNSHLYFNMSTYTPIIKADLIVSDVLLKLSCTYCRKKNNPDPTVGYWNVPKEKYNRFNIYTHPSIQKGQTDYLIRCIHCNSTIDVTRKLPNYTNYEEKETQTT